MVICYNLPKRVVLLVFFGFSAFVTLTPLPPKKKGRKDISSQFTHFPEIKFYGILYDVSLSPPALFF